MTAATYPHLTYEGRPLDTSYAAFGDLTRSDHRLTDTPTLRERMDRDGYLFLPGLLERQEVLTARLEILRRLAAGGMLADGHPIEEGIAQPGITKLSAHDLALDNPELDRVIYGSALLEFFEGFLGGRVRHFDHTWLRAKTPGNDTVAQPHCDIVFMGRGTNRLYTAWTPLGDCPMTMGGLMILEGSHRLERVKETYWALDVDMYCSNGPDAAAIESGQQQWDDRASSGVYADDAIAVRSDLGGRWLSADFAAGDVLIFGIFTMHASLDNQSNRFRLSSDSRYQLASEPADERWVGDDPPGHGPRGKKAMIC